MDFLGGALPNVMFIVGMLAIGLGLGIELKLVPLNKEIDKTGRIGAMIVGTMLVAGSLYIYLNPSLNHRTQPAPTTANAALAPVVTGPTNNAQPVAIAATALLSTAPTAANPPAEAPVPSATPAPTAMPIPTAPPPTQIRRVAIPDLHGLSENEAQDTLKKAGLQARKVDYHSLCQAYPTCQTCAVCAAYLTCRSSSYALFSGLFGKLIKKLRIYKLHGNYINKNFSLIVH